MISTAWSLGPSSSLHIRRNTFIVPVFTCGACNATLAPVFGSTAAYRYTHSYRVCFTAVGRVPMRAQIFVSVPC